MKTLQLATILSRISPRAPYRGLYREFSANCVLGEFGGDKKFASFSPEFLVLTRISLALRTQPSVTRPRRIALGFSKKQASAGANSAGIRDE
jgi:hypothetical protein